MVFKSYKGVIRSGNTLRLTNCGFIEQYKKNSTIEMIGRDSKYDYHQRVKFLDYLNVSYSLNKKYRWNLPEVIKEQLETCLESVDCTVTLLELHCIPRQNNCVGLFTNKGHIRQIVSTKKTFLNSGSILIENKISPTSSECKQLVKDDTKQHLIYKVVYPADIKRSNVYSDPTIAKYKSRGKPWVSLKDTALKSKIAKCKKRIVDVEEPFIFSTEELADEANSNEVDVHSPTYFNEYLSCASKYENFQSRKRKRRYAKRKKCNRKKLFYVNGDDDSSTDKSLSDEGFIDDCEDLNDPIHSEKIIFSPVRLVLPKQDVTNEYLMYRFQDKITFAKCRPRKFCIDMKFDVTSTLKKSIYFKKVLLQKLDLTSYLVFSFVCSHDAYHDVYDVSINIPNKQATIRIDTMYDMLMTDLQDVFNRTLKFIEGFLLPETFVDKEDLHLKARWNLKFGTIFPINFEDFNYEMNQSEDHDEIKNVAISNVESEIDDWALGNFVKFCGFCLGNLTEKPATSLQECGHWFCNVCWNKYLHNELDQRKERINCPECEQVVDYATMLTLANIHHIRKWWFAQTTKNLSSITICPSHQCIRILHRVNGAGICQCGVVVCLNCNMEGHWPASCYQFALYSKRLDEEEVHIKSCIETNKTKKGKNCPGCHQFVVCKSRSPFMTCTHCKEDFCWSCLTSQKIHPDDRSWCYKMNTTDGTHVPINTDRLGAFMDGDQYYLRAVESRKMRNRKHIKQMRRLVSDVLSKLLWWNHKNSSNQECFLSELFTDMVDLVVELNFSSEFCFVILQYEKRRHTKLIYGLGDIAPRLQTIAFDMYDILWCFQTMDRRRTLSKLQMLKNSGKSALITLLNLIRTHNT